MSQARRAPICSSQRESPQWRSFLPARIEDARGCALLESYKFVFMTQDFLITYEQNSHTLPCSLACNAAQPCRVLRKRVRQKMREWGILAPLSVRADGRCRVEYWLLIPVGLFVLNNSFRLIIEILNFHYCFIKKKTLSLKTGSPRRDLPCSCRATHTFPPSYDVYSTMMLWRPAGKS